jgi:hypothetical protein
MAAATVVTYGGPERNLTHPLSDASMHRWSLVAGNGDTHDTGFGTRVGIIETAITGTQSSGVPTYPTGNCAISSISNGVVTFSAAGSTLFDLIVWTSK